MNHQKQFKKKGGMKTEVGGDEKMKRRREKSLRSVGKSAKTYGKNEDNLETNGDSGIGSDQTES